MVKYNTDLDFTYVLGISLIIEAIKQKSKEIIKVYLSSDINKTKDYELLISLCTSHNIEYETNDQLIASLSSKENCYGIAIVKKFKSNLSTNKHIVLVDFNDDGELGTIIRSLTSFDFKDLVLINSSIDIYNPKVVRSSMGGFFHINIEKFNSLDEYNDKYHLQNIIISDNGDKELNELTINDNYAIIFDLNNNKGDYYIKHRKANAIDSSVYCTIVLNHLYK